MAMGNGNKWDYRSSTILHDQNIFVVTWFDKNKWNKIIGS